MIEVLLLFGHPFSIISYTHVTVKCGEILGYIELFGETKKENEKHIQYVQKLNIIIFNQIQNLYVRKTGEKITLDRIRQDTGINKFN